MTLNNSGNSPGCKAPKQNLLYIKMIKCASETLAAVFRSYAYQRSLSIVLPLNDKIYLGWPYKMDHESYRPSKTGSFNFLVDHSVFDEEFMTELMPADTVYVTSIREPYSQFKSMFNYYKIASNSNMSSGTIDIQLSEYLQNIEKYEAIYKSHAMAKTRYCIPDGFSMTKNLMSFNLGFPAGKPDGAPDYSDDEGFVEYFLSSLESRFKLVMIVEHFDESMVLLKRIMCWDMKDIVYTSKNAGQYSTSSLKERKKWGRKDKRNIEVYQRWSAVDYKLYDHFTNVFWKKIGNEGMDFYNELRYFKKINIIVNEFCNSIQSGARESFHKITISKTPYSDSFVVDKHFCDILGSTLMLEAKKYYDELPLPVNKVMPNKVFC